MNTQSLCPECYANVPATVFPKEGKVWLSKECKDHGTFTSLIENDDQYYASLKKAQRAENYDQMQLREDYDSVVMVEVTDRCNLECEHCYHIPTKQEDPSIEAIVSKIASMPLFNLIKNVVLCGAEPTVRKDLPELIEAVRSLGKEVHILTNGVRLQNKDYVLKLKEAGVASIEVGLNHESYISKKVHKKQLDGLQNLRDQDVRLEYVSYTLGEMDQLEEVLAEITKLQGTSRMFRVRTPSQIGKQHSSEKVFISDMLRAVHNIAQKEGKVFRVLSGDNNLYHCMVRYGDCTLRLIHWCDVHSIDYQELQAGPWAMFTDNTFSNFLHQIILRDGIKQQKRFNGWSLQKDPVIQSVYREPSFRSKIAYISSTLKDVSGVMKGRFSGDLPF